MADRSGGRLFSETRLFLQSLTMLKKNSVHWRTPHNLRRLIGVAVRPRTRLRSVRPHDTPFFTAFGVAYCWHLASHDRDKRAGCRACYLPSHLRMPYGCPPITRGHHQRMFPCTLPHSVVAVVVTARVVVVAVVAFLVGVVRAVALVVVLVVIFVSCVMVGVSIVAAVLVAREVVMASLEARALVQLSDSMAKYFAVLADVAQFKFGHGITSRSSANV